MSGGYIRVVKFWDIQNADAWKKAMAARSAERRHPAWCKVLVRRDYEMDKLPVPTRLLFLELLRLAVEHYNVIPNDSEFIAKRISMDSEDVREGIDQLLNGRWIKVTQSDRLSREVLEKFSPKKEKKKEKLEEENPPTPLSDDPVENLGVGERLTDEQIADNQRRLAEMTGGLLRAVQ